MQCGSISCSNICSIIETDEFTNLDNLQICGNADPSLIPFGVISPVVPSSMQGAVGNKPCRCQVITIKAAGSSIATASCRIAVPGRLTIGISSPKSNNNGLVVGF